MNLREIENSEEDKNLCFFTKILHQCSMENEEAPEDISVQPNITIQHHGYIHKEKSFHKDSWAWMEEDNEHDDITNDAQPHLIRAKSLRQEQEKKITNFISFFGVPEKQIEKQCKYFSPQKKKRIMKGQKIKIK